jgi:uncharacterized protein
MQWRGVPIIALGLVLAAVLSAFALDFPALTGRVVDEANILPTQTRLDLNRKLADFEAKSTDQLVVVTLKSLQGTSVEDFGYQLGRRWQIGQAGKNNGVLLIVAPNERKVRIEVGYGLEGTLTDAISRLIIENSILPRFRANDFSGGITRGVDDIIDVLTGDPEEWKQRAAKRPESTNWIGLFAVIYVLAVAAWIVWGVIRDLILSLAGIRRHRGKSSGSSYWVPDPSWSSGSSGGSDSGGGGGDSGGGFSGGGGSFGGGGASGSW